MATITLPPGARTRTQEQRGGEGIFCVECARSGRNKCSECGTTIANRVLRLGVGYQHGEQVPSYRWQHWTCVKDRTISQIGSPEKLRGLAALEKKDQDAVRQRFAGVGKAPRKKVHTLRDCS
ncbi:hypothetical protein ABPG75_004523 [Micractinium tetrahymenae]